MPDVRLVDLEVIKRYSLAVRQDSADAEELLAVLETDREALRKVTKGGSGSSRRRTSTAKRSSGSRTSSRSGR